MVCIVVRRTRACCVSGSTPAVLTISDISISGIIRRAEMSRKESEIVQ